MPNTTITTHSTCTHSQVLGVINVRFELGPGTRPAAKVGKQMNSECLIQVYALTDINAGSELLCQYGPSYWDDFRETE